MGSLDTAAASAATGSVVAAVTGLAAIWVLLDYVRRHTYTVFVIYRLVLAALVVAVFLLR